jgi:tetratricopeptide (TPR) repeat protein
MTVMASSLTGSPDARAGDEVAEVLRIVPVGTLHFLHGGLLLQKKRYADAETAFLAAADTPGLFTPLKPALLCAVACESFMTFEKAADPGAIRRAIANIKKILPLGPLSAEEAAGFARLAAAAREFDLARAILVDWEQRVPGDLEALRRRAEVELAAGAYALALQAADRALARKRDDTEAQRYRAQALEKLRELVKGSGK